MHGEGASYSAMPGLSLLTFGHEVLPVGLQEAANVLIPAEEAPPSLLLYHEVVERQVDHVHPGGREGGAHYYPAGNIRSSTHYNIAHGLWTYF